MDPPSRRPVTPANTGLKNGLKNGHQSAVRNGSVVPAQNVTLPETVCQENSYTSSCSSISSGSRSSTGDDGVGAPTIAAVVAVDKPTCSRKRSSSSSSSNDSSSSSSSSSSSTSSSSSSSSSTGEFGVHAAASESEEIDVEAVPSTSGAGAAGLAVKPKPYVQPILQMLDVPRDCSNLLTYPDIWDRLLRKKGNVKRPQHCTVPKTTGPPKIRHHNRHEFQPHMTLHVSDRGKPMQPAPSFKFTNLDEDCQYTVWITFTDLLGVFVGQLTHHDSPRPGDMWEGKVLTFDRLRLYPDYGGSQTKRPVTLRIGGDYRIQVNIGIVDESGHTVSRSVERKFIDPIFHADAKLKDVGSPPKASHQAAPPKKRLR